MGHVDALRIAPFGHDVAVTHDQPGDPRAHLERPDPVPERLSAEARRLRLLLIPRSRRLVRERVLDGRLHAGRAHPDLLGWARLPRIATRGGVLGSHRRGQPKGRDQGEHEEVGESPSTGGESIGEPANIGAHSHSP
jgi:hypothetical protein